MKRIADLVCHVCITRHWFFCRDLALQPFILCFAVGPNGFEKFCYSPLTPEANVRIDFTCTGLHHLSEHGLSEQRLNEKLSILNYSDNHTAPCQAAVTAVGRWNTTCNNPVTIVNKKALPPALPLLPVSLKGDCKRSAGISWKVQALLGNNLERRNWKWFTV